MTVALRVVLFHDASDARSMFKDGLGIAMPVDRFRAKVEFLCKKYHPVSLDDVRAAMLGASLPRRAVLVTIDDAYASVRENIAPTLERHSVPSTFFVNSAFLDHGTLGIDNLVTYVFNTMGGGALAQAAAEVQLESRPTSIAATLGEVVPSISIPQRHQFEQALRSCCDRDPLQDAREEGLYLSSADLLALPSSMEIASHTTSHARCRTLASEDEFDREISDNRRTLSKLTATPVSAFSVPYGSILDRPAQLLEAVRRAGHDLVFLVEGRLNYPPLDPTGIVRVSMARHSQVGTVLELEIEPRLRRLRDRLSRRAIAQ